MPRTKSKEITYRLVRFKDKRYSCGYRPNWYYIWTGSTNPMCTGTPNRKEALEFLKNIEEVKGALIKNGIVINKLGKIWGVLCYHNVYKNRNYFGEIILISLFVILIIELLHA